MSRELYIPMIQRINGAGGSILHP